MKISKTIVINLKRRPDRLDRTLKFLSLAKVPNVEVFYGIDGKDHLHTTEIMKQIGWNELNKDYLKHASWIDEARYWCRAKLGNIISHAIILKNFSEEQGSQNDWLMVLEDDIMTAGSYNILLEKMNNYLQKNNHEFVVISDRTGIAEKFLKNKGIRGTDAYLVTRRLAKELYPKLNLSRPYTPYHQLSMDLIYYHLSLCDELTIGCLIPPWIQNLNKGFPRDSDIEQ